MTDREYEKACVESALGMYAIEECDRTIAELEKALSVVQEHRRELINRFNLNKGRAISNDFDGDYRNGDFYDGAE